jgi:hypothetical protein
MERALAAAAAAGNDDEGDNDAEAIRQLKLRVAQLSAAIAKKEAEAVSEAAAEAAAQAAAEALAADIKEKEAALAVLSGRLEEQQKAVVAARNEGRLAKYDVRSFFTPVDQVHGVFIHSFIHSIHSFNFLLVFSPYERTNESMNQLFRWRRRVFLAWRRKWKRRGSRDDRRSKRHSPRPTQR